MVFKMNGRENEREKNNRIGGFYGRVLFSN